MKAYGKASGKHDCGNGFAGRLIEAKGITFCGLCGAERGL